MKKHTVILLLGLIALVAGVVPAKAALSIVTVPSGLNPGDKYRLVFVTDGIRDADPSDILVYNAFVAAEAAAVPVLNSLGAMWNVIGSTVNVDARDNTGTNPFTDGTGVPIYGLDGNKVADDNSDLWDGSIDAGIQMTPTGSITAEFARTGTGTDGVEFIGSGLSRALGLSSVIVGRAGDTGASWVFLGSSSGSISNRFYGMSSELTVPVPEPGAASLVMLAIGIGLWRRGPRSGH